MEEVRSEAVSDALEGEKRTSLEENGFNEKILTAYEPLNIPDVHWIIMSTTKEEEASMRIRTLRQETT